MKDYLVIGHIGFLNYDKLIMQREDSKTNTGSSKLKCEVCGEAVGEQDNFCGNCQKKLQDVCPKRWRKDGQPYRCEGEDCPTNRDWVFKHILKKKDL